MSNNMVAEVNFDILEDIGAEGKNSDVFKIRDSALNAEMVLKRVAKTKFQNPDQYFDEARILYHHQHPNVVEVNYGCQDSDFVYLTMPFYKNGSLSSLMATRFLTLREIIRFSVQFLSGLHHIHSNGLLHFDLKPDNILLSDRKEAMLSDFGLAKYMDEYGFSSPDLLYVKQFPPEGNWTRDFTTAFDIYQAGLTMYRMCVGPDAFNEQWKGYFNPQFDEARFVSDLNDGTFPDRDLIPVHIHSKIKNIIKACLNVDPDDRPEAALDVINAICDVDMNMLDWQYELVGTGRKWSKKSSTGLLYCLEVDEHGKSIAYKVSQTRRTNINEYTLDRISNRKIQAFLKQKI